jgi:voltage-gated sodium channel
VQTPFDGRGDPGDDLRRVPPSQEGVLGWGQAVLESLWFQRAITAVIAVNAVTLGLETSATVMDRAGGLLVAVDRLCLALFVIELAAKLVVYRTRFHHDPWNVFDFIVVGIALVPATGSLLALVFYVFSVMATKLFGASFAEWFGSIGASAYSLFQWRSILTPGCSSCRSS